MPNTYTITYNSFELPATFHQGGYLLIVIKGKFDMKSIFFKETNNFVSRLVVAIRGHLFRGIRGLRLANLDCRIRLCVTSGNDYRVIQCGRSMIEMLGVLAIVGVLSVGGIAGYGKAMEKFKLTKALDDYSMLINGLIEYKDNIRKIKTNDSLYGLVDIVQSLNLVPKTWKKVSAMHISDNYGNVLRIYSNNMDSENVFYVIDFYLGGTKISDKGSEVSPDFSSKLCLNLMTNLIVPLETAISSVNIWHTPDTSHAIGISKSKFYDLNYLHYACNSCGQDEACAISVIFKY